MRSLIARSTILVSRAIGPKGLAFVRRSLPLWAKRRLSRFVTHALPNEPSIVRAGDGHQFVTLNEPVFLHLRMEGYYERNLSDIARTVIQPGDTTVDVGANFGWYSVLMASRVGAAGHVYSFEPNKRMYEVLKQNIAINSYSEHVTAWQIGVGSSESTATLSAELAESAVGYVVPSSVNQEKIPGVDQIQIKTLDDTLNQSAGQISFVKVDVEGFEPHVIAGGRSIFHNANPPILQLELNTEALERQGADIAAFIAELNQLPAHVFRGEGGRLRQVSSVPVGEDADLFFFPKHGAYAERIKLLSLG